MTRAGLIDHAGGFALTRAGLGWLADNLEVDVAGLTSAPPACRQVVPGLD